jgi:DNA-3-methyladenine glycosylase II
MRRVKTKRHAAEIKKLVKSDPLLGALVKRHGDLNFTPLLERSPFESLVRSIAHQQLSGVVAEKILARFLALYPKSKFPTPEEVLQTAPETLRSVGFSNNKVRSIRDIAEKTVTGIVPTSEEIQHLEDEVIIERLTECFGVGRWTVQMLLIFQLGRMDVWPVDDFGIRKGFQVWKKKRVFPKPKHILKPAEIWSPYRTLVALYLWKEADAAKVAKVVKTKPKKKSKRS